MFNISFNIKGNNNFFSNLTNTIKDSLLNSSTQFGLMSNQNISIVSNNAKLKDKNIFWVKKIQDIRNFKQLKKTKQSDIYNKIFNDFKNTFQEFEVDDLYDDDKRQVFIVADNVLHTSFLPYVEHKKQDNIYTLGSHSNYFKTQNFNELNEKNIRDIRDVIFSNDLNVWLKKIVEK